MVNPLVDNCCNPKEQKMNLNEDNNNCYNSNVNLPEKETGVKMRKKNGRVFLRGAILLIMLTAIGYTLYLNFFKEKDPVSVGSIAPNFSLETFEGERVQLKDYRGKGVFLNYWGTWCKPCEKEMPYMEKGYKYFKEKGLEILAINIGESNLAVDSFKSKYHLSFPILMDRESVVTGLYGIGPIPTTFLIDKNGKVLKVITGSMTQEDILKNMELIKP